MNKISKEERMKPAIEAFHRGQYLSKTACATAFDVPKKCHGAQALASGMICLYTLACLGIGQEPLRTH